MIGLSHVFMVLVLSRVATLEAAESVGGRPVGGALPLARLVAAAPIEPIGHARAAGGALQLDPRHRHLLLKLDDLRQRQLELVLRQQQRRQIRLAGLIGQLRLLELLLLQRKQLVLRIGQRLAASEHTSA